MKHRTVLVAILAALVLAIGLGWLIWPRHNNGPILSLKIVRQTIENGKPVVFFRVVIADGRRIQMCDVVKVIGDRVEGPLDYSQMKSTGFAKKVPDFWAQSQSSPMGDPKMGAKEFGVIAPKNAPVWKLRVTVDMESPSQFERLKGMPVLWRAIRSNGRSFFGATKDSWNAFYGIGSQVLESELITNTVPAR